MGEEQSTEHAGLTWTIEDAEAVWDALVRIVAADPGVMMVQADRIQDLALDLISARSVTKFPPSVRRLDQGSRPAARGTA